MKIVLSVILVALLFRVNLSLAGPFAISCSGSACSNSNLQSAISLLEDDVNKNLPEADISNYLKAMANANIIANKGISINFADEIDIFTLGTSVGTGVDTGSQGISDYIKGDIDLNQLRGAAAQLSLMLGINLEMFDLGELWLIDFDRMSIFFNFFTYDYDKDDYNFDLFNIGFHARYNWIEPHSFWQGKMLRWLGVDISTGIEYSSLKGSYSKSYVNQSRTVSGIKVTIPNATASAGANIRTYSIPVIVSSGVQLLYLLTIYGGLGADFSFGSSEANAGVDIPNVSVSSGIDATLSSSVNLGDKDNPDLIVPRAFIGTQLNLWLLKIYAQLDKQVTNSVYGATVGVRITY